MSHDFEGGTTEAFPTLSLCHICDSVTLTYGSEDREIDGKSGSGFPMNSVLDLWLSNESSGTSLIELKAILWDSRDTNDGPGHEESEIGLSLHYESFMASSCWDKMVMSNC